MKHKIHSILIVGVGSSGLRFARIAKNEGMHVTFLQHRKGMTIPQEYSKIENFNPSAFDAVVVATPPSLHYSYVRQCIDAHVPTLVDKPFADSIVGISSLIKKAVQTKTVLRCGFNLRYLPVVDIMKIWIKNNKLGHLLAAEFSVGQYLPFWRPGRDYRKVYSAQYALGGGVALDLIHEIDIALHFFPNTLLKPIISSKLSKLDISVEDFVIYTSKSKPFVLVQMNYLSHIYTRRYKIIGSEGSLECDIASKKLSFISNDGKKEEITDISKFDILKTYEAEFRAFIVDIQRGVYSADDRLLGIDALKIALKGRRHVK